MPDITNKLKAIRSSEKGFTIVELLIVIVIIAILAAITIVAYNGIQSRGKASSAAALASNIAKKAEIYNADPTSPTTGYPATLSALTGAASSTLYAIDASSVSLQTSAFGSSAPTSTPPEKTIVFRKCGHSGTTTAPTAIGGITTQTGVLVEYWNNGSVGSDPAGQTSGSVGTFPIACFPAAS